MKCLEAAFAKPQVAHCKYRHQLGRIFFKSPVTDLSETKDILDDLKRMFHLDSDLRFQSLKCIRDMPFDSVLKCSALTRTHTSMPLHVI